MLWSAKEQAKNPERTRKSIAGPDEVPRVEISKLDKVITNHFDTLSHLGPIYLATGVFVVGALLACAAPSPDATS